MKLSWSLSSQAAVRVQHLKLQYVDGKVCVEAVEPEGAAAAAALEKLTAIGLHVYLEQAGVGDDEQVLERAGAWVEAQKPTSVGDIVQFNMVDDFVNALQPKYEVRALH